MTWVSHIQNRTCVGRSLGLSAHAKDIRRANTKSKDHKGVKDMAIQFQDGSFSTDHLTDEALTIASAIRKVLFEDEGVEATDGGGGSVQSFYDREGWAARGEDWVDHMLLVVVHDGSDLSEYFNLDYQYHEAEERMRESLESLGYFAEQITSWFSMVFRIEEPVSATSGQ